MDVTSVAAMAVSMKQMENNQQLQTSVLKMAMEVEVNFMNEMTQAIDASEVNGVGGLVDILA